jgi:hypothetical protein
MNNKKLDVDFGNKTFKKYKKLFKNQYRIKGVSCLFDFCYINCEYLMSVNDIELDKLFDIDYNGQNKDKIIDNFKQYGSKYLNDEKTALSEPIATNIKIMLNNLISDKNSIISDRLSSETRVKAYKHAKTLTTDSDETFLVIDEKNFNSNSLFLNLYYDNDCNFMFKMMNESKDSKNVTDNLVFTTHAKILSKINITYLPTKECVTCTEKNISTGLECGNVVTFCSIHKNSKICCTDSLNNLNPNTLRARHNIKNINNSEVVETRKVYEYEIEFNYDGDEKYTEIVYSLVEIKNIVFTGNFLYCHRGDHRFLVLLNYKEEKLKELDYNIIQKPDGVLFLSDIFKSLQTYYLKEFNYVIKDDNKILALYMMLQHLQKVYFNFKTISIFLGESSSGKSFYTEILMPMFTNNITYAFCDDITRNRFLGGQSNLKSLSGNTIFVGGYIESSDFLVMEEAGSMLNTHRDKDSNKYNPIEHLRSFNKGYVPVSIQSGRDVQVNANVCFLGNLENIEILK